MAITDRESLEAWLGGQPREVVEPIAVRAALRVLPGIATEGEATLKRIALPVIRAILTATVRSIYPSADLEDATRDAAKRVSDVASNGTDYSSSPATSIAESAALLIHRHSEPNSLVDAVTAALAVLARLSNKKSNQLDQIAIRFFAEITADADQISSAGTKDFFSLSIWLNDNIQDVLQPAWNELKGYFEDDRDVWSFWIRWYNGYLTGSPVSFELQREVALIPDGIWQEGAEAVARAIARIEAQHKLLERIRELEAELALVKKNRHSMGANNPPEPLDDLDVIRSEFRVLHEALRDLREEAEAEIPNKTRLSAATDLLVRSLAAIGQWCASKSDRAVDKAIDWGIPIGLGTIAANPAIVQAVIDAARTLLPLLP